MMIHQMVEIIAPESMPEGFKFSATYDGVVFHAIVVSVLSYSNCIDMFR